MRSKKENVFGFAQLLIRKNKLPSSFFFLANMFSFSNSISQKKWELLSPERLMRAEV
jgi:hypothetical protein